MELRPNMYVRIINDIRVICIGIGKIKQINQETIYVDMKNNLPISFNKNQISRASHNIIDLIEVGDYVNGVLIESIYSREEKKIYFHTFGEEIMIEITNENINNIVTKEQFESISYRIGE